MMESNKQFGVQKHGLTFVFEICVTYIAFSMAEQGYTWWRS